MNPTQITSDTVPAEWFSPVTLCQQSGFQRWHCASRVAFTGDTVPAEWFPPVTLCQQSGFHQWHCASRVASTSDTVPAEWLSPVTLCQQSGFHQWHCASRVVFTSDTVPAEWLSPVTLCQQSGFHQWHCASRVAFTSNTVPAEQFSPGVIPSCFLGVPCSETSESWSAYLATLKRQVSPGSPNTNKSWYFETTSFATLFQWWSKLAFKKCHDSCLQLPLLCIIIKILF